MGPKPTPLADRFWPKVRKGGGCWEWTASMSHGYGQIGVGGKSGRPHHAHRVAWELTNGAIPAGLFVCHHCDNKKCVRPDHLFLGTAKDNNQDRARKGRNPPARRIDLTQEEISLLGTRPDIVVARMLGVCEMTVHRKRRALGIPKLGRRSHA